MMSSRRPWGRVASRYVPPLYLCQKGDLVEKIELVVVKKQQKSGCSIALAVEQPDPYWRGRAYQTAMIRVGPPEPAAILGAPTKIDAPLGGIASRLATFSRPQRLVPSRV